MNNNNHWVVMVKAGDPYSSQIATVSQTYINKDYIFKISFVLTSTKKRKKEKTISSV